MDFGVVTPHHSDTFRLIWDRYLKLKYRRAFKSIHFDLDRATGQLDEKIPTILIPNHISWWDGFFCFEVQRRLRPGSGIYSLMLSSELRKFPVLRRLGCFGMDPTHPVSVKRAFKQFQSLVEKNPYRTLTFFPQGSITPMRQRPLGFKRGIEVLANILGRVQFVPVGIHIEPMNHEKPTAFLSAGRPIDNANDKVSAKFLEDEVTRLVDLISITNPKTFLAGGN